MECPQFSPISFIRIWLQVWIDLWLHPHEFVVRLDACIFDLTREPDSSRQIHSVLDSKQQLLCLKSALIHTQKLPSDLHSTACSMNNLTRDRNTCFWDLWSERLRRNRSGNTYFWHECRWFKSSGVLTHQRESTALKIVHVKMGGNKIAPNSP